MDSSTQAHDLALAYLNYSLAIERQGTDADHDEEVFFDRYKEYFNYFHDLLTEGC